MFLLVAKSLPFVLTAAVSFESNNDVEATITTLLVVFIDYDYFTPLDALLSR